MAVMTCTQRNNKLAQSKKYASMAAKCIHFLSLKLACFYLVDGAQIDPRSAGA